MKALPVLFALLITLPPALAADLAVTHARGPGGLSRAEARAVVVGAGNRIVSWKTVRARKVPLLRIQDAFARYRFSGDIAALIVPPLASGGSQGMVEAICGTRIVLAAGRWEGVPDELLPARLILAHEVGHALGATHQYDGSLMNRDPVGTSYRQGWRGLEFGAVSLGEMQRCSDSKGRG